MEELQTYEHHGVVLRLSAYGVKARGPVGRMALRAGASSVHAPGAGRFEIGPLELAGTIGELTLGARVAGRNIAYIYTEILLKDKSVDRYYGPVAREYLPAVRNRETRGVTRPDWGDQVDLTVSLSPSMRLLTDGADSAFCFWLPTGYGSSDHRLEGLYAPAGGTMALRAFVAFDQAGVAKRVLAYPERRWRSTPRELALKQGDRFTPFAQVLTPSTQGGDWNLTAALSTPLTLRERPLRAVGEPLMPGEYLAGVLVQDLNGGLTRKYVPLAIGK